MKKIASFVLVLVVIFFGMHQACKPKLVAVSHSQETTTSGFDSLTLFCNYVRNFMEQQSKSYQCPGVAAAIVYKGKIIMTHSFGLKQGLGADSIDHKSVFRIGSVSKGFAGLLTAILVEKGLVDLQDPVSDYIPEFKLKSKVRGDSIRIWHVLSHSVGVTEHAYSNLIDENRSEEVLLREINRLIVRDSTGKAYAYQNAVYSLIERVIEKATGLSYNDALKTYLFDPIGMTGASSTYSDMISCDNKAYPHKFGGKAKCYVEIPIGPHYYNATAAGGINATIDDMAKWLQAVMGYRPDVLSPKVREMAFQPRVNTSYDDKYYNFWPNVTQSHYGLGWRILTMNNQPLIFHGGSVNGYRTEIAFDPKKEIGVVFLFNSTCHYSDRAVPMFFQLYEAYRKMQTTNIRPLDSLTYEHS